MVYMMGDVPVSKTQFRTINDLATQTTATEQSVYGTAVVTHLRRFTRNGFTCTLRGHGYSGDGHDTIIMRCIAKTRET